MSTTQFGAVVSATVAAGYRLPDTFQTKAIPGSTQIELVRGLGGGADTVFVYFADRETAEVRETEVREALGSLATDVRTIVETRRKPRTLWPATMFGRVERVVAIAGIVLAVVNYWSVFFAAPRVSVQVVPGLDVVAGQRPQTAIRVANTTDAKTTVLLSSPYPATFEPSALVLDPYGEKTVTMRGESPVEADASIEIKGRARAGLLRGSRTETVATALTVWPRVEVGPPSNHRIYRAGKALDMTLPLRVGEAAPYGLDCTATILHAPGVTIVGAQPVLELSELRLNEEPGNELASLHWRTPQTDAFTAGAISLLFESRAPLSDVAWRSIASRITCKRRTP